MAEPAMEPRRVADAIAEEGTASDPTAACYPLTRPKSKRRAVGKGGPPCTSNPTLRLTVQHPTACAGDAVRVAWQASEPNARVFLQGIACDLPASGATTITLRESMTLRAMATTCAAGPETTAKIEVEPAPEITSFSAEHQYLASGGAGTVLHFSYDHGQSWAIDEPRLDGGTIAGGGPFGGSAPVRFIWNPVDASPFAPVLTVAGPCGTAAQTLTIPSCPSGVQPADIEITGGSGSAVVGSSATAEFWAVNCSRWWAETDNGTFAPQTGPCSGDLQHTVYTPARSGPVTITFYADGVCGIDWTESTGTIWDCARPLIESFVAGLGTLAVGQSTYVSYVTQSRDGQLPVGTVTSSVGNAIGGAVRLSGTPETRHTYTATRAGVDTVTVQVETPCGAATATLQITVR